MAETIKSAYYQGWSCAGTAQPLTAWYNEATDESDLGNGNSIRVIQLPDGCGVADAVLKLGQFDSNGSPTATFSVRLTNGTLNYDIILNAAVGRAATGDVARPGGRATDEVLNLGETLSDLGAGPWYVQIMQTAAAATATSSGRKVFLALTLVAKE